MKNIGTLHRNLLFLSLCFVLPIVLYVIVYFYFVTAYTHGSFTELSFASQYYSGIYKYRILSYGLMEILFDFLRDWQTHLSEISRIGIISQQLQAESHVYLSYFLLNTFFGILSMIMLFIYRVSQLSREYLVKNLINEMLLVNLLIAISHYVVVSYDNMSYSLQIFGFMLLLSHLKKPDNKMFFAYLIVIVISTLNRESSALLLSMHAAVLVAIVGSRKNIFELIISTLVFVTTYLALRFSLGFEQSVIQEITYITNVFSIYSVAGIAFFAAMTYLLLMRLESDVEKRAGFAFIIFALPYLVVCFLGGYFIEIRLWIPIFLGLILIGNMNISSNLRQDSLLVPA
jgi:hypothetical protein